MMFPCISPSFFRSLKADLQPPAALPVAGHCLRPVLHLGAADLAAPRRGSPQSAGSQEKGWVCSDEMEVSPGFWVVEWRVKLVSWCFLVVKWELTWFLNRKMRDNLVFSCDMVPNPQKTVVIYSVEWELIVICRVYHA